MASSHGASMDEAGGTGGDDPRRNAPAALRNREPLRAVLAEVLPGAGTVLEAAAGTGEHAAYFGRHFPGLTWQPTDPDPELRASIAAHAAADGVANVAAPLALDVTAEAWPVAHADAVVCSNLLHIAPWAATQGLLRGAARVLAPGAPLAVYGPFARAGEATAESNARFDAQLRERDPRWGLRDIDAVGAEAARHGLVLARVVEMPANNRTLVFRRAPV